MSLAGFTALVLLAAVPAAAQEEANEIALIQPDAAEWTEIVPGIDFGALFGDWQAEAHGKLVRLQPGVISPMHGHSKGYHAVVISAGRELEGRGRAEHDRPEDVRLTLQSGGRTQPARSVHASRHSWP